MIPGQIPLRKKLLSLEAWKRFLQNKWAFGRQWPAYQRIRFQSWMLYRRGISRYRILSEKELRATRKSDTLFVMGSGYSINDLTSTELQFFEKHDVLSFNWFCHQNILRCDYHFIREITSPLPYCGRLMHWVRDVSNYGRKLQNPRYADTVFLTQNGWPAISSNRLIGLGKLRLGAHLFPTRRRYRGRYVPPTERFSDGLTHGTSTLAEVLNFAYIMSWPRIVLVGIDLYDSRYFWMKRDEVRKHDLERNYASVDIPHSTSPYLIDFMRYWKPFFDQKGVRVEVYNPKSLLNQVFPVFDRSPMGQPVPTAIGDQR